MKSIFTFFLGGLTMLSAAAGILFYFQVPLPLFPIAVAVLEPDLKSAYEVGEAIELRFGLSSLDPLRSLNLEIAPQLVFGSKVVDIPKQNVNLPSRTRNVPISVLVPSSESLAPGDYRLRFKLAYVLKNGIRLPAYEGERVFFIKGRAPIPESPKSVSKPEPVVKSQRATRRRRALVEIWFIKPKGKYHYNERLPIVLELENKGNASAQADVQVSGDFGQGYTKELSFTIPPQGKVPMKEFLPLDVAIAEGRYTLMATVSAAEGSLPFKEVSATAEFSLSDSQPKISFDDPPLEASVGDPVSFRLQGLDDRGIDQVIFHIFRSGFGSFQTVPM
ncbi:MAG: hypothetical protein HY400_05275, partial [Elusimicrobia bacterium]|nr:hypothetical protein [Elusimicrobiota bacterium]